MGERTKGTRPSTPNSVARALKNTYGFYKIYARMFAHALFKKCR